MVSKPYKVAAEDNLYLCFSVSLNQSDREASFHFRFFAKLETYQ